MFHQTLQSKLVLLNFIGILMNLNFKFYFFKFCLIWVYTNLPVIVSWYNNYVPYKQIADNKTNKTESWRVVLSPASSHPSRTRHGRNTYSLYSLYEKMDGPDWWLVIIDRHIILQRRRFTNTHRKNTIYSNNNNVISFSRSFPYT